MTKDEAILKSEQIGGLSTRGEKEALWDLAMHYVPEGGMILEIGTWTGGSAVILGEVARQKNAHMVCVDAFSADMHTLGTGVRVDALQSVINNTVGLDIEYMVGDSNRFLYYLQNGAFDMIFVDGDHHYPRVERDIQGYWHKLKTGGVYFMHDYLNPCDVKQVVDDFFEEPEDLIQVDSSIYIVKQYADQVKRVYPPAGESL